MHEIKPFTPIARTNWRNEDVLFGIRPADRLNHIYAIGMTGQGKSTLLVNMALDDIRKGHPICAVDPHGDTYSAILARIPEHRRKDVVRFDATDINALPAYNPLHGVPENQRQLVASETVQTFKRMFANSWGEKLEYILRFCVLTLLDYPDGTLLDVNALLVDRQFRSKVLQHVRNPYITDFWTKEYALYTPNIQASTIMPILNKIGVLLANDTLRGIFGQKQSISLEECMNGNKVLLVNLAKGVVGEDVSTVLGSFLTTGIQTTAMRRAGVPVHDRKSFFLYVDEAHNYMSQSFSTMLSEIRKFGVGLFITHQFTEQLEPEVRSAILSNVGTVITFKLGLHDSKIMANEFHPVFGFEDFMGLARYNIYIKLQIDGVTSRPFSATTEPMIALPPDQ